MLSRVVFAFVACTFAFAFVSGQTTPCNWISPTNGVWCDANNWSCGVIPGANHAVTINPPHAVNVTFNCQLTVASFTLGSIDGSGGPLIAAMTDLTLQGGTATINGDAIVGPNGFLSLVSGTPTQPLTLQVGGTLRVMNSPAPVVPYQFDLISTQLLVSAMRVDGTMRWGAFAQVTILGTYGNWTVGPTGTLTFGPGDSLTNLIHVYSPGAMPPASLVNQGLMIGAGINLMSEATIINDVTGTITDAGGSIGTGILLSSASRPDGTQYGTFRNRGLVSLSNNGGAIDLGRIVQHSTGRTVFTATTPFCFLTLRVDLSPKNGSVTDCLAQFVGASDLGGLWDTGSAGGAETAITVYGVTAPVSSASCGFVALSGNVIGAGTFGFFWDSTKTSAFGRAPFEFLITGTGAIATQLSVTCGHVHVLAAALPAFLPSGLSLSDTLSFEPVPNGASTLLVLPASLIAQPFQTFVPTILAAGIDIRYNLMPPTVVSVGDLYLSCRSLLVNCTWNVDDNACAASSAFTIVDSVNRGTVINVTDALHVYSAMLVSDTQRAVTINTGPGLNGDGIGIIVHSGGGVLQVRGNLRVRSPLGAPAGISVHPNGGTLQVNDGFSLNADNSPVALSCSIIKNAGTFVITSPAVIRSGPIINTGTVQITAITPYNPFANVTLATGAHIISRGVGSLLDLSDEEAILVLGTTDGAAAEPQLKFHSDSQALIHGATHAQPTITGSGSIEIGTNAVFVVSVPDNNAAAVGSAIAITGSFNHSSGAILSIDLNVQVAASNQAGIPVMSVGGLWSETPNELLTLSVDPTNAPAMPFTVRVARVGTIDPANPFFAPAINPVGFVLPPGQTIIADPNTTPVQSMTDLTVDLSYSGPQPQPTISSSAAPQPNPPAPSSSASLVPPITATEASTGGGAATGANGGGKSSDKPGLSPGGIAAVVVASALVVGIVAFALVRRRRLMHRSNDISLNDQPRTAASRAGGDAEYVSLNA